MGRPAAAVRCGRGGACVAAPLLVVALVAAAIGSCSDEPGDGRLGHDLGPGDADHAVHPAGAAPTC